MDGVGLKSVVYTASITISATGPAWPGLSAVTVSSLRLSRYNTTPTYLVVTILGVDIASGVDKVALFQTGSLPSTTVPPTADAPDWLNFAPTVESFGLDTSATGSRSVYVWLKDKAGKVSTLKTTAISVAP